MNATVQAAYSTDAAAYGNREHVGYRYLRWTYYVEPGLNAAQKAERFDAFAVEFEALPASSEPYEGWGEMMAYLCRRIARRHRGEFVGEWVPQWERQRRARDGTSSHETADEPAKTKLMSMARVAS